MFTFYMGQDMELAKQGNKIKDRQEKESVLGRRISLVEAPNGRKKVKSSIICLTKSVLDDTY